VRNLDVQLHARVLTGVVLVGKRCYLFETSSGGKGCTVILSLLELAWKSVVTGQMRCKLGGMSGEGAHRGLPEARSVIETNDISGGR